MYQNTECAERKRGRTVNKTSGILNETDKLDSNCTRYWVYMHHVGVTNTIIEQEQSKLTYNSSDHTQNKDSW